MKIFYALPLFAFTFILTACMIESRKVDQRLEHVLSISGALVDPVTMYDMLDAESREYLKDFAEMTVTDDNHGAGGIGNDYGYPMVTMLLGAVTEYSQADGYSSISDTPEKVLTVMAMNGIGIFRHHSELPIKPHEPARADGTTAYAPVVIPMHHSNKNKVASTYVFHKEDGEWRLNLLSTFGLQEKMLRQQLTASGLPPGEFFADMIANPGQEVRVRYRIGY